MQDELPQLIQLQTFDTKIDTLTKNAEAFDPLIQKKNAELEGLKNALKLAKESITSFQVKRKSLELEADEKEKLLKKHQAELNSLKSNDAYKAMLGEIDAAKKALNKIEDDILVMMESIDQTEHSIKENEKKFKDQESVIRGDIQKLEKEKAAILSQVKTVQEERGAFTASVSPHVYTHYDSLRAHKGGLAIVPVQNESCGGCRMKLPPNKIVEVRKGKDLILCESCMRILYQPIDPKQASLVQPSAPAPAPVAPPPPEVTPTAS